MANAYDLVVLGGGPCGYTGAIRAAKLGLRVALIEKKYLGGTCLNCGCIPTKVLLHSSQLFSTKHEWESLGILAQNVAIDQNRIYERKDKVVGGLREGVRALIRANGIDLFEGEGKFLDKNTIEVEGKSLSSKYFLIATGSSAAGFDPKRPLEGIESVLNSDGVLESPVLENDIVIVGGGVIAVEFATYFLDVGKNVTMLVGSDRILKNLPEGISSQLSMLLKRKKLKIISSIEVKRVEPNCAFFEQNGVQKRVEGRVVAAVGRTANIKNLGLDKIGLDENSRFIRVDKNMFTGIEGVYAAGDVVGGIQLAHYAAASAITAVESMLNKPHSMELSVCPSCIYTFPEIAFVGKSESELENPKVGKFMMGANGKSLIEGVKTGYIKVIADQNDVLVGAELFCVRATDIVGELALAIKSRMNVHELASVIHPHPTVMEAVGESYEDIFGLATHKV